MSDSAFAIRPMQPGDEPFIFRAWLKGYWPHFPGNVVVSESEFMARWHRVIEKILADPRTRTVVAHVEGEPDSLLGFACGSDRCLHWAYVKQAFRRMGICWKLTDGVDAGGSCRVSHWNPHATTAGWPYTPELLKEYAP